MQRVAVTGRPGIGKTTFCLKVFDILKWSTKHADWDKSNVEGKGRNICGFVTREVRDSTGKGGRGNRIGFMLENLKTGEKGWLARVDKKGSGRSVRVGKYVVLTDSIDIFSKELDCGSSDLVIIDEIGPMELKSKVFINKVENLLSSDISCLFSIHLKSNHSLLRRIREKFDVYLINEENRNSLVKEVAEILNE